MNALRDTGRLRKWFIPLALYFCLAGAAQAASGPAVLILDSTVIGTPSIEAQEATSLALTVNVVNAATWSGMTTAQFQAYQAIILGDPSCGNVGDVAAAAANASTWGKAVDGNVIIIGTDPVFHAFQGGDLLTRKAVDYAAAQTGKTGAYISLSCYYTSAAPGTPVPLLDGAFGSGPGSFQVRSPGCFNDAHITATHPVFTTTPVLTDATLQNWSCSVHEAFDAWPLSFVVLAIAKNSGSSYTAPDGTVGSPYILARGDISVLSDITLSPKSAVNEIGTTHVFTATVKSSTGSPLPGVTVTFKIIAGPNVGLTATAVTDASGKATFTYASTSIGTDMIEAQFVTADGKTQTSNLAEKQWIQSAKTCMRVLNSEIQCETDASGKPKGNYVWRFRFQNLSGKNVFHLFLVGLPTGVTVDQDHFVFSSPIPPNGLSPIIKVVIKGATPGPLSFKVVLLDETLDECCSITVSLDLPACDCAQIVSEITPRCFFPVPPPFRYTFKLQNLSPTLAQYLLLAPVSPSDRVTPILPSQLTVTQDAFSIPPLATGSTTGNLPVFLSGPQAVGGKDACLLISLHDKDLVSCCSIVRCFRLPDCSIKISDIAHLGVSTVVPFEAGFRIDGIGASGADGAAIDPHSAQAIELAWLPLDAAGPLPNGAFFEISAAGKSGQAAGTLRVTQTAGAKYQISTAIGGAATYKVEVFKGDQPAGTAGQQRSGINTVVIWPRSAGAEVVPGPNDTRTLGFNLETDRAVPWQLTDGSTLTGDRIRITPEASQGDLEAIETFALRAAKIQSITVTGFSVSHDCNDNGIPDAEDIATGTSTDLDGNGTPDECQERAHADLNLSLATGFNQITGATLPPGSADDDWQVTNASPPGPAKVVIHPTPAWPAPLAGSAWISVDPNRGRSIPGLGTLRFEDCFCIGNGAATAELDLQLRSDDKATVFLNDSRIGGPGGAFLDASPLHLDVSGAVGGSGPFRAGQNCLRVEVNDSGGVVTGLDLGGTVRAANGSCAPTGAATSH